MLTLDHIVFLVNDLEKSIKDFEQVGYTVSKGGKHDNGMTENALIHFENGTFLELLALQKTQNKQGNLPENAPDFQKRFVGRAMTSQEGIIDFCLLANNGLADYEAIKLRNLPLTMPLEMKRFRPEGSVLSWHIFTPFEPELPFVMTPYQPATTPNPAYLHHANDTSGIEKVKIYVADFEVIVKKYELLLGTSPSQKNSTTAIFELQKGKIEIINGHQLARTGIGFLEIEPTIPLP